MDDDSSGGWSEAPPIGGPLPRDGGERYRIDRLIGQGGMGEVYLAWDTRLERHVALKRVRGGASERGRILRLLREARVTARLEHPGIVAVLDQGELADGTAFYTMRLVRGRTLGSARAELSTGALLKHVQDAVQAVAFAHAHGVVHRDLKPENVMVGGFGETQVVDWGLARAHGEDGPAVPSVPVGPGETELGAVVGTRRYLSAEASAGSPMGPADDVYALGATLVELVTGHQADDTEGWRALAAQLPAPELVAIATHALADRDDRYPDAKALADDLGAYLDGRPVGVHAYSTLELLRRALGRYRWPLRVAGAAGLAAAAGLTVAVVGIVQERLKSDAVLARSLTQQAVEALRSGSHAEAGLLAAHALALDDLPRARGVMMAVGAVPEPSVQHLDTPCPDGMAVGPDGWVCATADAAWIPDGPRYDGLYEAVARGDGLWVGLETRTLHYGADGLDLEGEGIGLLYVDGDRAARLIRLNVALHDASTGRTVEVRPCGEVRSHRVGAWAPAGFWTVCLDGTAARVGFDDQPVHVPLPGVHEAVTGLAWSSGTLFVATGDGRVELRDEGTGALEGVVDPGVGRVSRIDAAGRWLLVEGDPDGPVLVDLGTRRPVTRLPRRFQGARFQRDGTLLATQGGLVRLDPSTLVAPTLHAGAGLASIAVSPDGALLAGSLGNGAFVVWDARTGREVHREVLDAAFVTKWAHFSPDGTELVVANLGARPVRRSTSDWSALDPLPVEVRCRRTLGLAESTWCLAYSHTFPARLDRVVDRIASDAAMDDAGQNGPGVAAVLDHEGGVRLLDDEGVGPLLGRWQGAERVDVTADGSRIVLGLRDAILLLDRAGHEIGRVDVPGGLQDVTLGADGAWLAASWIDGTTRVWRTSDLQLRAELVGIHDERVVAVLIAGDRLYTAGWDGRVHAWSLDPLTGPVDLDALEARWGLHLEDVVDGSPTADRPRARGTRSR